MPPKGIGVGRYAQISSLSGILSYQIKYEHSHDCDYNVRMSCSNTGMSVRLPYHLVGIVYDNDMAYLEMHGSSTNATGHKFSAFSSLTSVCEIESFFIMSIPADVDVF